MFYDLHSSEPYRLDVFAASVKDGRGNEIHRRLFVVQVTATARCRAPADDLPRPCSSPARDDGTAG